jgi:hypothetical protein
LNKVLNPEEQDSLGLSLSNLQIETLRSEGHSNNTKEYRALERKIKALTDEKQELH